MHKQHTRREIKTIIFTIVFKINYKLNKGRNNQLDKGTKYLFQKESSQLK